MGQFPTAPFTVIEIAAQKLRVGQCGRYKYRLSCSAVEPLGRFQLGGGEITVGKKATLETCAA